MGDPDSETSYTQLLSMMYMQHKHEQKQLRRAKRPRTNRRVAHRPHNGQAATSVNSDASFWAKPPAVAVYAVRREPTSVRCCVGRALSDDFILHSKEKYCTQSTSRMTKVATTFCA